MENLIARKIIKNAIIEDLYYGDITTDNLIDIEIKGQGEIIFKEDGILAGLDLIQFIFDEIDPDMEIIRKKEEGEYVRRGELVCLLKGRLKSILKAERIILNFLQRMSAIASKSYRYSKIGEKYGVDIVDTRKTLPGMRPLDKYSVKLGGCKNHRLNLSDAVMIKDNHIDSVGTIREAVGRIRKKIGHTVKVEVEVRNLIEFKEALREDVDIILLDNMTFEHIREAVRLNKDKILEVSGNINESSIEEYAKTGVNIISVGELTHSVKALDISLNIRKK